jgi:hypothetical protein
VPSMHEIYDRHAHEYDAVVVEARLGWPDATCGI